MRRSRHLVSGDFCHLDHFICSAYLFEHGRCERCSRKPYSFNRPDWSRRRRILGICDKRGRRKMSQFDTTVGQRL